MDINKLFSAIRSGSNSTSNSDPRTEFQRDFDRIIFSSAFRRLQNKTQVFPLPGSVFVHNRLTHSLEVASVGRSLGTLAGDFFNKKFKNHLSSQTQEFFRTSLYNVIAAACLCHDIGNPAFGHSGEDAMASFFIKNETTFKSYFNDTEWLDFKNFEGNANAIRILTQQQNGKLGGTFNLTYSTLAAIIKYPCESSGKYQPEGKEQVPLHRKKIGFFKSEKDAFSQITANTSMIIEASNPIIYKRHPFVWLVEAADDICYNIVDLEDAHRLSIIENGRCTELLLNLLDCLGHEKMATIKDQLEEISDKNERISYLRAKAIHVLTMTAIDIYSSNIDAILKGEFSISIFDSISNSCNALQQITDFSSEYIYNARSVVEIENAGYNVMYELLSHFVPAVIKEERTHAEKKALRLMPEQFHYKNSSPYQRVMGVIDYVSGMTDNYAVDLYKKIKGIEIGMTI